MCRRFVPFYKWMLSQKLNSGYISLFLHQTFIKLSNFLDFDSTNIMMPNSSSQCHIWQEVATFVLGISHKHFTFAIILLKLLLFWQSIRRRHQCVTENIYISECNPYPKINLIIKISFINKQTLSTYFFKSTAHLFHPYSKLLFCL